MKMHVDCIEIQLKHCFYFWIWVLNWEHLKTSLKFELILNGWNLEGSNQNHWNLTFKMGAMWRVSMKKGEIWHFNGCNFMRIGWISSWLCTSDVHSDEFWSTSLLRWHCLRVRKFFKIEMDFSSIYTNWSVILNELDIFYENSLILERDISISMSPKIEYFWTICLIEIWIFSNLSHCFRAPSLCLFAFESFECIENKIKSKPRDWHEAGEKHLNWIGLFNWNWSLCVRL
jgi:hypothetical protein